LSSIESLLALELERFTAGRLSYFSGIVKFPEMSNFVSPPAKLGVYYKELRRKISDILEKEFGES